MMKLLQTFIFFFLLTFTISVNGQKLDSLKTQDRISDFRDHMIDWTGQDLLDATFPNSWPILDQRQEWGLVVM